MSWMSQGFNTCRGIGYMFLADLGDFVTSIVMILGIAEMFDPHFDSSEPSVSPKVILPRMPV